MCIDSKSPNWRRRNGGRSRGHRSDRTWPGHARRVAGDDRDDLSSRRRPARGSGRRRDAVLRSAAGAVRGCDRIVPEPTPRQFDQLDPLGVSRKSSWGCRRRYLHPHAAVDVSGRRRSLRWSRSSRSRTCYEQPFDGLRLLFDERRGSVASNSELPLPGARGERGRG